MDKQQIVQEKLRYFCINVKKLREHTRISQQQLAKEAGLPLATLRQVEKGTVNNNVRMDFLMNICKYFVVNPDSLMAPIYLDEEQEGEKHADGAGDDGPDSGRGA